MSSLYGLHGANGVTSVVYAGGDIYSTGRDGHCRRLALEAGGHITEVSMFKVCCHGYHGRNALFERSLCFLPVACEGGRVD